MTSRKFELATLLVAGFLFALPGAVSAQDVRGSSDHPIIGGRYPDARIVRYNQIEFDEFKLLTGPVSAPRAKPASALGLEGKVTRITYEISKERSTLEVMRNYDLALKDKGFKILYRCKSKECGGKDALNGRGFNHAVVPYWPEFAENYDDQRYRAAKLETDNGPVHAAIYVVRNTSSGGRMARQIYVQVDVVEPTPMDVGLQVVPAERIRKGIAEEGHVAIYGILFDTDSADIRSNSRPALDQIGKLLKETPSLDLYVVGHTDDQGSLKHNLDLSKRRAEAVLEDLVKSYGVSRSRLQAHGLAFLAPKASNGTDEGRQKNRRVELVEK